MRKIISTFLLLLILLTNVYGFTPYQKPHPGLQINWANPSSKGLVGLWLFNEGSGNKVSDLSGNRYIGTLQGDPQWVAGKFGSALDFDGTGDYVDTTFDGTEFMELTVSLWIRPDSVGLSYLFDNNAKYSLSSETGKISFIVFSGGVNGKVTVDPNPFNVGTWHHFVGVHSATHNTIYVDGTQRGQTAYDASSGIDDAADTMKIGIDVGDDWGWNGLIDHVMTWNRAYIASEIAELYREPFVMFEKDDIAILATAAVPPPPPTGQMITIIMTSIPLFLIPFFFLKRRKLCR